MISKALENAVEAVIHNCKPSLLWGTKGQIDPDNVVVEKVHIDNLKEELDRYRLEREDMGKEKLQQTPAIYTIVALLRSQFHLNAEIFSDAEIAAAWANVQGMPFSEQMDAFCDFMGISNNGD